MTCLFRPAGKSTLMAAKEVLAGHDLAYWCPLDGPCHADILIEVANGLKPSRK